MKSKEGYQVKGYFRVWIGQQESGTKDGDMDFRIWMGQQENGANDGDKDFKAKNVDINGLGLIR